MNRKVLVSFFGFILVGSFIYLQRAAITGHLMERVAEQRIGQTLLSELNDGLHVLLCGAGGPLADPKRSGPCVAIIAGETIVIVDAGSGGSRQLARMQVPVGNIDTQFLTHFHSDHYTGFGEFFISRWIMGGKNPLKVYGPPPIIEIVKRMLLYYEYDIDLRVNEGKSRIGSEIDVTVISPGDTFSVNNVEISAVKGTNHGNVDDILSYKFHKNNKTIVIASDGSPTIQLLPFSKDADILVMHACVPELIVGQFGGNAETAKIVASHHATFKEIGEIATNAKVKKLVFSHVVPPLAPDEKVIEGISEYFSGEIIAGKDQMVL